MLKLKEFDTTKKNFVSDCIGWSIEGKNQNRPFDALWIDRSDGRSMFLSFTRTFMDETTREADDNALFDIFNNGRGIEQINYDFNFVFKNTPDAKGNPPILNLADDGNGVDIMAMRVIVNNDNEIITNVNTCLGVNNYSAWISKEKQELILVSSFDNDESCLEIFVQNMETKMVVKYLIGFNCCFATEPFPGSKKFQVPDQIKIPITRYDLKKVSESIAICMSDDELSVLEKKIIGGKNTDIVEVPYDISSTDVTDYIRELKKKFHGRKVILVRTTPLVTGTVLKMFHNNVSVLSSHGESGALVKIV
jgi:hypothetical protein